MRLDGKYSLGTSHEGHSHNALPTVMIQKQGNHSKNSTDSFGNNKKEKLSGISSCDYRFSDYRYCFD